MPETNANFYPSIFGAVLLGIGIALFIEAYLTPIGIRGLGLGGAIAINLCAAGALVIWLLVSHLNIPARGYVLLWAIAIIVLILSLIELLTKSLKYK